MLSASLNKTFPRYNFCSVKNVVYAVNGMMVGLSFVCLFVCLCLFSFVVVFWRWGEFFVVVFFGGFLVGVFGGFF